MKLFAFRLVLGILIVLSMANHASAATPDVRLNAIVSSAAGKPATVTCTFNAEVWDTQVQETTKGQRRGSTVGGYAFPNGNVVWLGPQACYALYDVLTYGVVWAGIGPTAYGLLTLLHEAAHLRGVVDEGETDCTALAAFRSYTDDVGVPATVVKPFNVKGKFVNRRVANPQVRLLGIAAQRVHDLRPPNYRGSC